MNPRELILLGPYRLPAQNALMLGNEDIGAFLNGLTALWHPAAARGAAGPPRVASPYDHEQPSPHHLYAVPDSPPLYLPDDWEERVRQAGAIAFRCTADRAATLDNLRAALRERDPDAAPLLDLPPDRSAPFFGVGFGYAHVEALFEAMEHENVLATADLWADVQKAIAAVAGEDVEAWRGPLKSAAERLLAGREVLYPVGIHLIDLVLLDERPPGEPLPADHALTLVACGRLLERLAQDQPEWFATLRERVTHEQVEVTGGTYQEREDALLPLDSQLWNLRQGLAVTEKLLGQEPRIFARRRFAFHPRTPMLLQNVGLGRAILLAFDDAVLPSHRTPVISWPSPDGKQVEAFTRAPHAADSPQTFFHVAHHLHKTIMQDHAATFVLLHTGAADAPWYHDWLTLSRLAPVLGDWTTLSRYMTAVMAGEYTAAANADDFHGDYLSERTGARLPAPVSAFARHARLRRRIDSAWTLAALLRALAGRNDASQLDTRLTEMEDRLEQRAPDLAPVADGGDTEAALTALEGDAAAALAARLTARAAKDRPGYLVLNPCSYARRVALELDDVAGPLPVAPPIRAAQFSGGSAKLVVDVPALGFAWLPRQGPPGTPPPVAKMKLADQKTVRNEFFEAEIDHATGGLRAFRDPRTRTSRLAQQLVFNPGSTMKARRLEVVSTGPALGEVITEGMLLDAQEQELATFRQRFRAWLGRPILELRIEITPKHAPQGYPWHAYYGARLAWGDERATLLRGCQGLGYVTTHTRPETPDYLELRAGRETTAIFPCGLPFHQRHGGRMVDVILAPEGETATAFDLAFGLDRELLMPTAQGLVTPVPVVPTVKGPPHVGATGWLFHLDMPNLLLLNMKPAADGVDAVVARLLECAGRTAYTELRCVRDPQRAMLLDAKGQIQMEVSTTGDAVLFEAAASDLSHLRVDFG